MEIVLDGETDFQKTLTFQKFLYSLRQSYLGKTEQITFMWSGELQKCNLINPSFLECRLCLCVKTYERFLFEVFNCLRCYFGSVDYDNITDKLLGLNRGEFLF